MILRIIITITVVLICVAFYNIDYVFRNNLNEIYAQNAQEQNEKQQQQQESFEVIIPRGAASPEVDVTNLAPRQWYVPKQVTVSQGDNITWINEDTEPHTVTSGVGAGIESLLTNEQGRSNGIFDSGLFGPEESWSYNFTNPGRYTYFCTIHPWMDGIIIVKEKEVEVTIPTYPVNASGNRLDRFPVHTLTNNEEYDIDLGWDPQVILTGEPVTFIIDFFDVRTNERLHLLPYDFVVHKNGTEIDRVSDISEVGSGSHRMLFNEPGSITIKIDNVGNTPAYTEFNTLVYENPEQQSSEGLSAVDTGVVNGQTNVSKLISPLTLVYITYGIIAGLPAAVTVIVILYRKGKI